MGIGSRLKRALGPEWIDDLQHQIKETVDQGLDRHLRIAVTGLSRSGKTVFITALVHHLMNAHQGKSLPFLSAAAEHRIISIKRRPSRMSEPFPLDAAINALGQEPPQWPPSTTGLAEVNLAIKYKPGSRLKRLVTDSATLNLDIVDYPGEWLLDLPLLRMDFETWCERQQALFDKAPRSTLGQEWYHTIQHTDWSLEVEPATLTAISQAYTALLNQLREQPHAQSVLQPGRCILPGDLAGDPLLQLFPLPGISANSDPASGYNVMKKRFNAYKEKVVKRFYEEHFSRFDRQVVLVDCLKALNNGKPCFDDMKLALTEILQSFNYGSSGFLRRIFSPRIDKVLFASSKADHVTANQHHNLDKFLELIIQDAQREMRFEEIDTSCMALASIRSTDAAVGQLHGQQISCLKGFSKADGKPTAIFPGEVPTELPTEADWNSSRFQFLDFAPKRLPTTQLKPEHHIRLDQALEYLIGDHLS
jgi:predicted YcjX-like family ATPase